MIDTDERGQEKIRELFLSLNDFEWSSWEYGFIEGLDMVTYKYLSGKQKTTVGTLWEKLKK